MNLIAFSVIHLVILSSCRIGWLDAGTDESIEPGKVDQEQLSEKLFAKLFRMRRKDSKELLEIVMHENYYERQFKMLEAALEKILKILDETKLIIQSMKYDPLVDKFPVADKRLADSIVVNLQNVCLFGEILLHTPDISYLVLDKLRIGDPAAKKPRVEWKPLIEWCLKYAKYFYNRIVDTKSQELLFLLDQDLHPDRRTPDYINPYRGSINRDTLKQNKVKQKKKLKKGPQLAGRDEL